MVTTIMKRKALNWLVISYHTSPGHNFQQGFWVPGWSRAGRNFCNLLAEHELAALLFGNCLELLMFPKERVRVQNWVNMKVQIGGKRDQANGTFLWVIPWAGSSLLFSFPNNHAVLDKLHTFTEKIWWAEDEVLTGLDVLPLCPWDR